MIYYPCKLFFPATLIWLTVLSTPAEPEVRYFASVALIPWYSQGSLDGQGRRILESNNVVEETLIPRPKSYDELEFSLGARIDASTVAIQLGLAGIPTEITPVELLQVDASWFRFDFQYLYSFFNPRNWQLRTGVGFGFSRLNVPKANLNNGQWGNALFTGSGPTALLGVGYFPFRHFGISLDGRLRLFSITHLTNSQGEYYKFNNTLYQMKSGLSATLHLVF